MKTPGIRLLLATLVLVVGCSLMPPRRQYVKEAKRQIIPKELVNTHWMLESWNDKTPEGKLTMNLYEKGRFTFYYNDLNFDEDNLWYIVRGSNIAFQTRPIEKIVWTDELHGLEPGHFALDLRNITDYKVDDGRLILTSTSTKFVFIKI